MFEELAYKAKVFLGKSLAKDEKRIIRYLLPVILTLIILATKGYFYNLLGEGAPFLLLALVVILSSWYGGFGPGIFATFLTALANQFIFLSPSFSLEGGENWIRTLVFIIEGIFISTISEARKQADEQKDDFMSVLSHEIKNPLSTIIGYSQLISRGSKDKKIKKYTGVIERNSNKINYLINDLNDIAMIEQGKLKYNKEEFSFYSLVKEIITDHKSYSGTHKIILKGSSTKTIYGDRYRIGEVISNLITNAIKYSPDARKIDIQLKDEIKGVELSIKDYGIGISQKDQKKLFDRFYRGTAEKTGIHGLGMGLYISGKIVNKHKGKIRVKSIIGKGTTFSLFIPSVR
jgi:signal transduction histidine kinase